MLAKLPYSVIRIIFFRIVWVCFMCNGNMYVSGRARVSLVTVDSQMYVQLVL